MGTGPVACSSSTGAETGRRDVILKQVLLTVGALGIDDNSAHAEQMMSSSTIPALNSFNGANANKVIVVTGASKGGIGFAIARQLATRGFTIVPVCRSLKSTYQFAE